MTPYTDKLASLSNEDISFVLSAIHDTDIQKELMNEVDKTSRTNHVSQSVSNIALDAIHSSEVQKEIVSEMISRFGKYT